MTAVAPSETLMPVEEALSRLLARLGRTGVEEVGFESAAGRVLAQDVVSGRRLPGCDNSAMDGYAVRAADCGPPPTRLPVRGEARAGAPIAELAAGSAMTIMTGAALPRGADSIVRVEDTEARDGTVEIRVNVAPGDHLRRAGEDVEPGMVMVPAGRRVRAVEIAACAGVGAVSLRVYRRPRVAILGGGDELVPADVEPAPHQVTDSNAPMLAAAVAEAGGQPILMGVASDDPDEVRRHLEAAAECDLIVSSAGVSVGAHDHVRAAVEKLGSVDVWRIAMRPGKPLLLGEVRGTPLLGLPGNPASSAVCFELFGRPALLTMQGAVQVRRRRIPVRLAEPVTTPLMLETYLRARLEDGDDGFPLARLSGGQSSSMLRSLSDADALVLVPVGIEECPAGTLLAAVELT